MSSALGSFEKVLRIGEGRRLKRLRDQAAYITSLEPDFERLSDDELRACFESVADALVPGGLFCFDLATLGVAL